MLCARHSALSAPPQPPQKDGIFSRSFVCWHAGASARMFRFDGIEFIHELFAGTRAHLRRVCLRVRLHSARGMIGNDGWCAEQTETECSACACARFGWITVKYLNVLTHTHTHAHARRTHSAHTHMSIFFMAIGGVVSDRKVHTAHHRTVAQSTQFVLGCFVFFFYR